MNQLATFGLFCLIALTQFCGDGGEDDSYGDAGPHDAGSDSGILLEVRVGAIDEVEVSYRVGADGSPMTVLDVASHRERDCETVSFRGCRVERCEAGSVPSYGEIHVTSDTLDERFEPTATGYTARELPGTAAWFTGPITISATGAELPAFESGVAVPIPLELRWRYDGQRVRLRPGRELRIERTAGPADAEVLVRLRSELGVVRCLFPADQITDTVPSDAMALLHPPGESEPTIFEGSFDSVSTHELIDGDRVLRLSATHRGGAFEVEYAPYR